MLKHVDPPLRSSFHYRGIYGIHKEEKEMSDKSEYTSDLNLYGNRWSVNWWSDQSLGH